MKKGVHMAAACLLLTLTGSGAQAQGPAQVGWSISASEGDRGRANDGQGTAAGSRGRHTITLTAKITPPWHIYDLRERTDGPMATAFDFDGGAGGSGGSSGREGRRGAPGYKLVGPVRELDRPVMVYDSTFRMEIGYHSGTARFAQKVETTSRDSVTVRCTVQWMACREGACTPPQEFTLTVRLPGNPDAPAPDASLQAMSGSDRAATGQAGIEAGLAGQTSGVAGIEAGQGGADGAPAALSPAGEDMAGDGSGSVGGGSDIGGGGTLWGLILSAILWALAALFTPCVFPMVPMTVSYFLKTTGNPRRNALIYGLMIVALYTIPIAIIIGLTRLVGGEAMTADLPNRLATHWLPNLLFFVVFMLFAASFLGAFEIVLPSRIVGRAGRESDRSGMAGIFFMALTLVLVSFSCTGPIVGSVLIGSTSGEWRDPIIAMAAFSTVFALPFTLLAFFPRLMDRLPHSGGWLGSVKATLGFIEVALGLKFLSVADQSYHWGILPRELYLAIWIVVFTMLGFYLLGKLRLRHDAPVESIGVVRLTLAIAVFTFVVWMIPGMFGAPLKALSGYLPPIENRTFASPGGQTQKAGGGPEVSFGDRLHLPHGLGGFFDLEEGAEYARKVRKPLFVDITGLGCASCRQMEERVWSAPQVLALLESRFVIVALFTDDRTSLPREKWITTASGTELKTLGRANSYIAQTRFGVQAQPFYLIVDPDSGRPLVPGRGYNLDVKGFEAFLLSGIQAFDNR